MITIHGLELIGPVGQRKFEADGKCQPYQGHEHNYDHATFIVRGRVEVLRSYVENGALIECEPQEYGPESWIEIPAKMRHTITPLEDAAWLCIFSHRDSNGLIAEKYCGNETAYQ